MSLPSFIQTKVREFSEKLSQFVLTSDYPNILLRLTDILESSGRIELIAEAGANYDLALTDAGAMIEMGAAGPCTVTIPLDADVDFPVGSSISIRQVGAGTVTITPTFGVTIQSAGGALDTSAQYAVATILKIDVDTWAAFGSLV